MVKFPMKFEVEANASKEVSATWTVAAQNLAPVACAIPPEFGGPGGGYSPEELFAFSIVNCIIATFKVYAERSSVTFENIHGKADLTLDKLPTNGALGMTQIDITLDVNGASDIEKTKSVLENAIKDCAVSNSIKTGKTFHVNVT